MKQIHIRNQKPTIILPGENTTRITKGHQALQMVIGMVKQYIHIRMLIITEFSINKDYKVIL